MLTPENNEHMYTQGPPKPIHYRDQVLVELALLQYWGVITTLKYSKYSSPIFAVQKLQVNFVFWLIFVEKTI